MGLFGLFGGGKGKKKDDGPSKRRGLGSGEAFPDEDDEAIVRAWREERGENSPFAEMEKVEQAGFPGIGANDAEVAEGMAKAIAGANRKVKLTDEDRELFQYVRNMTMRGEWYYRDRMNVPRGPCTLPVLREAWIHGVVDEHTLVWGKGLMDWLPIRNVRTLVPQIRTVEVQLATWVKRTLVLGPALKAVRKQRREERPDEPTEQVVRWKGARAATGNGGTWERTALSGVAAAAAEADGAEGGSDGEEDLLGSLGGGLPAVERDEGDE